MGDERGVVVVIMLIILMIIRRTLIFKTPRQATEV